MASMQTSLIFGNLFQMEVAGPGYINIFLNKDAIAKNIGSLAVKVSSNFKQTCSF